MTEIVALIHPLNNGRSSSLLKNYHRIIASMRPAHNPRLLQRMIVASAPLFHASIAITIRLSTKGSKEWVSTRSPRRMRNRHEIAKGGFGKNSIAIPRRDGCWRIAARSSVARSGYADDPTVHGTASDIPLTAFASRRCAVARAKKNYPSLPTRAVVNYILEIGAFAV